MNTPSQIRDRSESNQTEPETSAMHQQQDDSSHTEEEDRVLGKRKRLMPAAPCPPSKKLMPAPTVCYIGKAPPPPASWCWDDFSLDYELDPQLPVPLDDGFFDSDSDHDDHSKEQPEEEKEEDSSDFLFHAIFDRVMKHYLEPLPSKLNVEEESVKTSDAVVTVEDKVTPSTS